jgi:hypothetical protein
MTVKIAGNTIINHRGYALESTEEGDRFAVSDCLVLVDTHKFRHGPLLWLGIKIITRYYNKAMGGKLGAIKAKVQSSDTSAIYTINTKEGEE